MEVSNDIIENTIIDWKKKDISKEDRAKLIKLYMEENNLSERQVQAKTGINRCTLHDWLNPEVRDKRRNNAEVKLGSLLSSLQNIKNPEIKIEIVLAKIEKEIIRLKELIARKKIQG